MESKGLDNSREERRQDVMSAEQIALDTSGMNEWSHDGVMTQTGQT